MICSASIASLIALSGCQGPKSENVKLKEGFNQSNNPFAFDVPYEYWQKPWNQMPSEGDLRGSDSMPWSGDYWATFKGGITYRWQMDNTRSSDYRSFLYQLPTEAQIKGWLETDQMDLINQLSPAEKYDILNGRYDLPLTRYIRSQVANAVDNGKIPTWFGICHGWAAAAYMEKEPRLPVSRNDAVYGKQIVFHPSDLKALISQVYADVDSFSAEDETLFLGSRFNGNTSAFNRIDELNVFSRISNSNLRDINPGAFHLALTYYVGQEKRSFVAEVDKKAEVWNHPVVSYSTRQINSFPGGYRPFYKAKTFMGQPITEPVDRVYLRTQMEIAVETGPFNPRLATSTKTYTYSIEVGRRSGRIYGGEWAPSVINREGWPDFAWDRTQTALSVEWYDMWENASESQRRYLEANLPALSYEQIHSMLEDAR